MESGAIYGQKSSTGQQQRSHEIRIGETKYAVKQFLPLSQVEIADPVTVYGEYIGSPWSVTVGRLDLETLVILLEPSLRKTDVVTASQDELAYTALALLADQNNLPASASVHFMPENSTTTMAEERMFELSFQHHMVPFALRTGPDLEHLLPQRTQEKEPTSNAERDAVEHHDSVCNSEPHFEPHIEWCHYRTTIESINALQAGDLLIPPDLRLPEGRIILGLNLEAAGRLEGNEFILAEHPHDRETAYEGRYDSELVLHIVSPVQMSFEGQSDLLKSSSCVDVAFANDNDIRLRLDNNQVGAGEFVNYRDITAIRILNVNLDALS